MSWLLAALLLHPPWLVYQVSAPVPAGCAAVPAHVERLRTLPGGTLPAPAATARDPAWSPDGTRVAFSSGPTECTNGDGIGQAVARIWLVGTDGRGLRPLTRGAALDRSPSWSPDGRRIAFSRFDIARGSGGIYAVGVDGRGLTRLSPRRALALAWSPGGASLAYVPGDRGVFGESAADRVDVLDLAFHTRRVLRRVAAPADVAWSADGARIAVAAARSVLVLRVDGSLVRRIPVAGVATGVAWSPDGRRLAYGAGGAVYVVGAAGGAPTRVAAGDAPDWR